MSAKKPTPEEVMKALLADGEPLDPLEGLKATGDAVFALIRFSDVDCYVKNAFYQLEKQFLFYSTLMEGSEK
jgi:hypothetical protein